MTTILKYIPISLFVTLAQVPILLYSQPLTTIQVIVPKSTDEVFITGNQAALGNWSADKIKMNHQSDFIRSVTLPLTFPASFKFTRGSWEAEGVTGHYQQNDNIILSEYTDIISYTIKGWTDNIEGDNYSYPFSFKRLHSAVFNQQRTVAIALPQNYTNQKRYPVIYVLDANNLLEPVLTNARLLSRQWISDDGTDYGYDNIPEVIIVGIYHKNRGYEAKPNLGFNTRISADELTEGAHQLKEHLFKELIPWINSRFNSSSFNVIIGHSDTGHFVMNLLFQKDNPLNGFIGFSVNSEFDHFNKKLISYMNTRDSKTIYLGYGSLDHGFKELAKQVERQQAQGEINNPRLRVGAFDASHNQLPAIAVSSALKHIFSDYKNLSTFYTATSNTNFSIDQFINNYLESNKKYGEEISFTPDDIFTLMEIAAELNNQKLFKDIITWAEEHNVSPQNHYIFYLARSFNDFPTADSYIQRIVTSNDPTDYALTYYNVESNYLSYFLEQKKSPAEALTFLDQMISKSERYRLEFSYAYARTGLTYKLEETKSKKYLKYCERNYRVNPLFTLEDLQNLKKIR
ncbi:MAG: alpha/beta hydrolase-fold protein [Cyclobacteriaceae bacterium]|jgi:predicted alpha/beta superfamily hydrolase|nr:alpha/beta hydrolase-fold protein [Cyclobacteriaceae bacterium]